MFSTTNYHTASILYPLYFMLLALYFSIQVLGKIPLRENQTQPKFHFNILTCYRKINKNSNFWSFFSWCVCILHCSRSVLPIQSPKTQGIQTCRFFLATLYGFRWKKRLFWYLLGFNGVSPQCNQFLEKRPKALKWVVHVIEYNDI
jgi:hypothetical protein